MSVATDAASSERAGTWRSELDTAHTNPQPQMAQTQVQVQAQAQGAMADLRYGYGAEWTNAPAVELFADQPWHQYPLSHELKG